MPGVEVSEEFFQSLGRRKRRALGRGIRFLDHATMDRRDRATRAERYYGGQLRKIATTIGDMVKALSPATPEASAEFTDLMARYSRIIAPWARALAGRMVGDVAEDDWKLWRSRSQEMGRLLHKEIETAPTGQVMRSIMGDQVDLITSLPIEAAQRVHKLTIEGITQGTRAKEIAAEIMKTGEVTKSRALLIAKTEVSRTATTLLMTRAQHVGSTEFEWRTAGDSRVRPSHRALNRRIFRWDDPPECDPGHHALPGCIWNCRCTAIPIIED